MPVDPMDPTNPVTALCIEGMNAEGLGEPETARQLFERAWQSRTTSLEAAVAAHYLARHQATPEDALEWNRRALAEADASDPTSVAGMLPSLHLNLGRSHEDIGDLDEARRHYQQAREASGALADDGYGRFLRAGIERGIERVDRSAGGG